MVSKNDHIETIFNSIQLVPVSENSEKVEDVSESSKSSIVSRNWLNKGEIAVSCHGAFVSASSVDEVLSLEDVRNNGEVVGSSGRCTNGGESANVHPAFGFCFYHLGVKDLLSVSMVCKSLHTTVCDDSLLWKHIHICQPLNEKITKDALLRLTERAQGTLQCLRLGDCCRITANCLKRVLDRNPQVVKLGVPGCTMITIDDILSILRDLKSVGKLQVKHLEIGGLFGVTDVTIQILQLIAEEFPFCSTKDTKLRKFTLELLEKFGLLGWNHVSTLLGLNLKLSPDIGDLQLDVSSCHLFDVVCRSLDEAEYTSMANVVSALHIVNNLVFLVLLQQSFHLVSLQRQSQDYDFIRQTIVVHSDWFGSILEFLYGSLPRPPDVLYVFSPQPTILMVVQVQDAAHNIFFEVSTESSRAWSVYSAFQPLYVLMPLLIRILECVLAQEDQSRVCVFLENSLITWKTKNQDVVVCFKPLLTKGDFGLRGVY